MKQIFFWTCFFYNTADVGTLISDSSAFSKSSLNIWKFSVYILLKSSLENFEHYFASMWNECNCVLVWIFFPGGSEVKASASNAGDLGSIPGSGRSPGEGSGNPRQYSCLENPMNRWAWWDTVFGITVRHVWAHTHLDILPKYKEFEQATIAESII